ncbi:MAG: TolC family protein [Catalinimonas sp.]
MKTRTLLLGAAPLWLWLWLWSPTAKAQTEQSAFSLREAVEYALTNNQLVQNARLDVQSADARVGEIRAIGLPQVNGVVELTDNFAVPAVILPAEAGAAFGPGPVDPRVDGRLQTLEQQLGINSPEPPAPPSGDDPLVLRFGIRYQGNAVVSASQILFDGSYVIGLRAANTYKNLARKQMVQQKRDVAVNVAKAYYGVLVNQDRLGLLEANIDRLDSTYRQTRALFENGFAEEIDALRLEVQLNNLRTDRAAAVRGVEVARAVLKFQMGYDLSRKISLTDRLAADDLTAATFGSSFNYSDRVEYAVLEDQRELAFLDVRNNQAGYLPKLSLFARYGYNAGYDDVGQLFTDQWFDQGAYGLRLNVPIFDGLMKKYKVQQARVAYEQTGNGFRILQQQIDLERQQSTIQLNNALSQLENQERNLELANEVVRVTKLKFEEGIGTNLEVTNAEADLKAAQTNYYNALYDAYVARVDLQRANGTLFADLTQEETGR